MPTELADGTKLEFDEEVYDIGPGKCTGSYWANIEGRQVHWIMWRHHPAYARSSERGPLAH